MTKPTSDATRRFSERVEHYVRARPSYPDAIVDLLVEELGHRPGETIADIGSGTGLSAIPFLKRESQVVGVEPNAEMRDAATRFLAPYPGYRTVEGRAESTGLDDASVAGILVGQAFHWFDAEAARAEFRRILVPDGWVALVWNRRKIYSSPFLELFEAFLLEHGIDYRQVDHTKIRMDTIREFFESDDVRLRKLDNEQRFDLDGLRSRVLSMSYMPSPGHERHPAMIEALEKLFEEHQVDGTVRVEYDVLVYLGRFPIEGELESGGD